MLHIELVFLELGARVSNALEPEALERGALGLGTRLDAHAGEPGYDARDSQPESPIELVPPWHYYLKGLIFGGGGFGRGFSIFMSYLKLKEIVRSG